MKKVIIEIRDGVAKVVTKSKGVKLIIKDFNVQEDEHTENDEHGVPYVEETYGINIEY